MTNLNYIDINYDATFTKIDDSTDLGTVSVNKTVYIDTLFEAPVNRDFYRYILDGNTLNYNKFGNDAYISNINTRDINANLVNSLSHFVINKNNYYFCNSDNKINAYTNTGTLYYTTENDYINIKSMILGVGNNIYVKYDTNKIDCLVVLANMLDINWTISNDDFGDYLASDDNYIYVNSISNKNQIYVINPRLVNEGDYIDRIITITGFSAEYDSNEHKTVKYIKCYNNYMFCLFGTDNDTRPSYICKIDLNDDSIIFNIIISDNYTIATSNLYTVNNTIYFAKHNILYKMDLDIVTDSQKIFNDNSNIIKIGKYNEEELYILTDNNRLVILKLNDNDNKIGNIIYNYNDSNDTDKILLDIELDNKNNSLYFIYNNSIENKFPSLIIDDNGLIGSPCYKLDGGGSYIEFESMPMSNKNFSTSISFKPTKINNNKSVLFGGSDNYNWKAICWSDYLNVFCSITENDNVTSIMPDDGSENWYTNDTRTLPVASWNSICWDNVHNLFYIVSNDNKFAYSSDGLNWSLLSNVPNDYEWNKVYFAEYINNIYVIQKNSNKLIYNMDVNGTWREITLPITSDWKDITYRNSDKLLLLVDGTNIIQNIKNHNVFNIITVGDTTHKWTNIIYNKYLNKFIAIGKNTNKIAYSSNGIIWEIKELPYIDVWVSLVYDPHILNKYLLFSENNDTYLISDDLINWTTITELDYYYNIKDVAVSNSRICVLLGDVDLTFYPTGGSDVVIDKKHCLSQKNIFNRNVTKSTFQLYFSEYDNFLYVLYGNYKFKCYFKLDSSKLDEWQIISAIVNNNNVKVYLGDKLISNHNITDDLDVYNYDINTDDKIYFIHNGNDTFYNIYTFRIGNSTFNNNDDKDLYGYVNDFILYNYSITEKEIDDISKVKVLHCRFNYDYTEPVYDNLIHDISCYKHNLTGNSDYITEEDSFKFDSNKSLTVANKNYNFNNDKFTLSFWYKNKTDINDIGSKILVSNYNTLDPYMMLMADQFKPTTDIPVKLIQSRYMYNEFNIMLFADRWISDDDYYYYTINNTNITSDTIIDILPSINISEFALNNLIECGVEGHSQTEGSFIVKCYKTKPVVDVPIRVITRTWVPEEMILQNITLLASKWNNNLYTIELDNIKSTDTIEMIINESITYKQYNAIISADLTGYSQTDGSFVIKANGTVPTINVSILFYINSTTSKITNMTLDRNYWLGESKPFNYRLELEDMNDNFVNIIPADDINSVEMNMLQTVGIRDGGIFGIESSGWVISYMPTDEDSDIYSLHFVMMDKNRNLVKFKLTNDNHDYNEWNNYTITYNNGIFNSYVNGIPQKVENYKNYITSNNIVVGTNISLINDIDVGVLSGEYFMKEFRIYHEVLNHNYILELYNRGNMLNSNGALYTTDVIEDNEIVDIYKEGLKVKTITELTNTDPDSTIEKDILINLNYGIDSNEVLLKDEIYETL